MQETGDVRFDPWVGKIPPTESGLAQKDQETVGRDAVCIQNLLPTSFQFQGLLPLWFWELGKREGPFDLNGSMSVAGRFPWSCSGLADYWGCSTERCVHVWIPNVGVGITLVLTLPGEGLHLGWDIVFSGLEAVSAA